MNVQQQEQLNNHVTFTLQPKQSPTSLKKMKKSYQKVTKKVVINLSGKKSHINKKNTFKFSSNQADKQSDSRIEDKNSFPYKIIDVDQIQSQFCEKQSFRKNDFLFPSLRQQQPIKETQKNFTSRTSFVNASRNKIRNSFSLRIDDKSSYSSVRNEKGQYRRASTRKIKGRKVNKQHLERSQFFYRESMVQANSIQQLIKQYEEFHEICLPRKLSKIQRKVIKLCHSKSRCKMKDKQSMSKFKKQNQRNKNRLTRSIYQISQKRQKISKHTTPIRAIELKEQKGSKFKEQEIVRSFSEINMHHIQNERHKKQRISVISKSKSGQKKHLITSQSFIKKISNIFSLSAANQENMDGNCCNANKQNHDLSQLCWQSSRQARRSVEKHKKGLLITKNPIFKNQDQNQNQKVSKISISQIRKNQKEKKLNKLGQNHSKTIPLKSSKTRRIQIKIY